MHGYLNPEKNPDLDLLSDMSTSNSDLCFAFSDYIRNCACAHIYSGMHIQLIKHLMWVIHSLPQSKHCVLSGTTQAFQSLKSKAPPVTILIKAMQYDSIM